MQVSQSTLLLGAVLIAAGAYALGRETAPTTEVTRIVETRPEPAREQENDPSDMEQGDLPPNHPPVPSGPKAGMPDLAPDDEGADIKWAVPTGWRTMPNPSSMRIATYAVPHAAGDATDADVSVTRAGGDVSANIQRWGTQFEGAGEPKLKTQTVHGFEVTVVEIEGTYASAMSADKNPRPGWALLGAIVRTRGQPYFFKMTGPASTVHGARAAFTSLVDSIQPTEGSPAQR